MKASELRLGNWVNDVNSREVQVDGIESNQESIWLNYRIGAGQYINMIDRIEPIELTPEWLERMDLQIGGYGVSFDIDGGYLYNETSLSGALCNRMNFSQIQYVHQLQNLFFSLTGKELEIKQLELA